MKKLAVVFSGNGYHNDRPLLHHATNLMRGFGFEVIDVEYGIFPKGYNMDEACELVTQYAQEYLCHVRWKDYDQIVFIAKSLGTVAAGYIADQLAYPIGCLIADSFATDASLFKKGASDGVLCIERSLLRCRFNQKLLPNASNRIILLHK